MKTKIRTLIAISALGMIGFTNTNATAGNNKKVACTEVCSENMETMNIESLNTDEAFIASAEELTAMETDAQVEKYAAKQIRLIENEAEKSGFLTRAESMTAESADLEVEKYAQKQISLLLARTGK